MVNCTESFYSYIDPETGAYTKVGLIERVARFNDTPVGAPLFDDQTTEAEFEALIETAKSAPEFSGVAGDFIRQILLAARRAERITRHKFNPNCPSIGDRQSLLDAQVLTNTLPEV